MWLVNLIKSIFHKPDVISIEDRAMGLWDAHAIKREGLSLKVYKDTRGKLTVGIGHLVLKQDNLKFGDVIGAVRVSRLFKSDSAKALELSIRQSKELKQYNAQFLSALISVNFQLGDWSKVFTSSYPDLVKGDYKKVISNLKRSKWMKQTPVRVNDFINSIEIAYS